MSETPTSTARTSEREARPRRTQEERSAETRARLLDATIASLVEVGYASTTTTAVCERAGVSRGAQVHHFPRKQDLVVAAVAHLAARRAAELRRRAEAVPDANGADRIDALLELVTDAFGGPLFDAALELWVAVARSGRRPRRSRALRRAAPTHHAHGARHGAPEDPAQRRQCASPSPEPVAGDGGARAARFHGLVRNPQRRTQRWVARSM
jgi:AcrR family transcriptional regulator